MFPELKAAVKRNASLHVKCVLSPKFRPFPGMRTLIEAETILEFLPTEDLIKGGKP